MNGDARFSRHIPLNERMVTLYVGSLFLVLVNIVFLDGDARFLTDHKHHIASNLIDLYNLLGDKKCLFYFSMEKKMEGHFPPFILRTYIAAKDSDF